MILDRPVVYSVGLWVVACMATVIASMMGRIDHYDAKLVVAALSVIAALIVKFLPKAPNNG